MSHTEEVLDRRTRVTVTVEAKEDVQICCCLLNRESEILFATGFKKGEGRGETLSH